MLFWVRNKGENEYTLVPACPKISRKLGVLGWYLISALKGQRQGYCFRSEGEAEIDRKTSAREFKASLVYIASCGTDRTTY